MDKRLLLKGASILSASQLLIAACTFVRNIVVARFVSVEDFGIATAFALTMSLIEMTSYIAFDKLLVQDKEGADDRFVAASHFLQFAKSVATGVVLYLTAAPMANLFDLPDIVWAFQLLGLLPIIKGLMHFDFITYQRNLNFRATAVMDAVPQILTVAVAFPVSWWLGDYRAMLVLVFAQPICFTLLSHLYAKRPYRWALDKALTKRMVVFGWPLMINGLLLFAIFHGDKTVVGATYGVEVLGWYGVAFSLTLLPGLLMSKIFSTLLLPPLSKSREDPRLFLLYSEKTATLCFAIGVFIWVFFVIGGEALIYLSYGERYMEGATIIAWLALMQAVRAARGAPNMVATAMGDTKNTMWSSSVRAIALPLATVCALNEWHVVWLAITGTIGEVAAFGLSLYWLRMGEQKAQFVRRNVELCVTFGGLCIAYSLASPYIPTRADDPLTAFFIILAAGVAASLSAFLIAVADSSLRRGLMSHWSEWRTSKKISALDGEQCPRS